MDGSTNNDAFIMGVLPKLLAKTHKTYLQFLLEPFNSICSELIQAVYSTIPINSECIILSGATNRTEGLKFTCYVVNKSTSDMKLEHITIKLMEIDDRRRIELKID